MASKLERIAAELVAVLDDIPGIVEELKQLSTDVEGWAGSIKALSDGGSDAGKVVDLLLIAADRCGKAAEIVQPAHTRGREWASQLAVPVALSTSNRSHRKLLGKPPVCRTIEVDDRFTYETDDLGRVVKATTVLTVIDLNHPRNKHAQKTTKDKLKGVDDAGHIFARIFQGPGNRINLVPMHASKVNRDEYAAIEKVWRDELVAGREVDVTVTLQYDDESHRPSLLMLEYQADGEKQVNIIDNPGRPDESQ